MPTTNRSHRREQSKEQAEKNTPQTKTDIPAFQGSKTQKELFFEMEDPAFAEDNAVDDSMEDSLQHVDIDLNSSTDAKVINDVLGNMHFEDDLSLESVVSAPEKELQQIITGPPPNVYRRAVSFSELHTRQHAVVLGDHPCCNNGLPVALGWEVQDECSYTVDEYETLRQTERKPSRNDLRLSLEDRHDMLLDSSTGEEASYENEGGPELYSERTLRRVERKLSRERRHCSGGFCSSQQRRRVQHQEAKFFQQPPGTVLNITADQNNFS